MLPALKAFTIMLSFGTRSKALFASRRRRKTGFFAEKREKLIDSVRRRAASSWLEPDPWNWVSVCTAAQQLE